MIIDMRMRAAPGFYETTGKAFGKSPIPSVAQRSTAKCVEEMDAVGTRTERSWAAWHRANAGRCCIGALRFAGVSLVLDPQG